MYEDSCELYQYMNHVEVEKKGFQKLIDIKSVIIIILIVLEIICRIKRF